MKQFIIISDYALSIKSVLKIETLFKGILLFLPILKNDISRRKKCMLCLL